MPGDGIEHHQQADQHENRSAHGIQHEVQGRLVPAFTAPAVDEEKQRDQGQFPEYVEQRPVLCHEHAEHRRFQYQHQRVIAFDAAGDAGRGQDGEETQQRSEQHHGKGEAIDPQRERGSQTRIPGYQLTELKPRGSAVEPADQPPGQSELSSGNGNRQGPNLFRVLTRPKGHHCRAEQRHYQQYRQYLHAN